MTAIRSLEQNMYNLFDKELDGLSDYDVAERIHAVDDRRMFAVAEALRRGFAPEKIHHVTKIDMWFLNKLSSIIAVEKRLAKEPLDRELLLNAKDFGFLDETIADLDVYKRQVFNYVNQIALFSLLGMK